MRGATNLVVAIVVTLGCGARATGGDRYDLVDVGATIAGIALDVRYATPRNFTNRRLYPQPRCFLRRSAAAKLAAVQAELARRGLGLKVFDCYRPLSVQRIMWELVPDERYVADPAKGSRHNRGAAVDLTLVRLSDGAELSMPTDYDDFTEKAHRGYQGATLEQAHNREELERVMTRHGFIGLPTEWWHFDAEDWRAYSVLDIAFAEIGRASRR